MLATLAELWSPLGIAIKYWPLFLSGIKFTLLISLTGTVIGLVIGLFVGGVRAVCSKSERRDPSWSKISKKVLHAISSIYIEFFRGTPMIVQAVFIYYGFKPLFQWTPVVAGIAIISINTGAYMAEIIRAGIQSVDVGQTEAARSIGMTAPQTMFHIVLPQAIKNSFPSIGNEFVVNIKDSSVLNVISITEIYFQMTSIAGSTFNFTDSAFVALIIYLVLTFTTTRILRLIEIRMSRAPRSYPTSQTVPEARINNQ